MSVTNPGSEMEALMHVVSRLVARFPLVGEETITAMVADELVDFDRAGIRAFIPVLVEGRVQNQLRARHHDLAS